MKNSIKSNRDFQLVYKRGRSYANKYLVMYVMKKTDSDNNRLGISVSKKVGNSVIRHRVSRLIRESFRLNNNMFNSSLDIVIVARTGARDRDYNEIEEALIHLAKLHRILIEKV